MENWALTKQDFVRFNLHTGSQGNTDAKKFNALLVEQGYEIVGRSQVRRLDWPRPTNTRLDNLRFMKERLAKPAFLQKDPSYPTWDPR
jgi:hypothetical protein